MMREGRPTIPPSSSSSIWVPSSMVKKATAESSQVLAFSMEEPLHLINTVLFHASNDDTISSLPLICHPSRVHIDLQFRISWCFHLAVLGLMGSIGA
ncbi:hypothetical protein PVK06_003701 [Gossypium arboreum]|uniref:Uncharacterized protein n=1 Tax=Gossypium arboreum TaxID=29729 RepID=A0ABR0QPY3_GOSAR|nr:hypothetical protein PVK06_003701 [Gossypium arboreum]